MRQALRFMRNYKMLNLAIFGVIASAVLEFFGYSTVAHWLIGALAMLGCIPQLVSVWKDFRQGSYGLDILGLVTIVTALVLHQYWTALAFVVVLNFSKILLDIASNIANSQLNILQKGAPHKAHVLKGRKVVDVKVSEVLAGDKLIINPLETVPVDAVIIEGTSTFEESILTGDSQPKSRSITEQIIGGTINQGGLITAQALRSAKDSQYNQVIRIVRSASGSQAPFTRLTGLYSILFTVSALALALAVWIFSGDSLRFLQVIVVASCFPLLKATPLATVSGLGKAARYGIIFKNLKAFERLANARVFIFEKTGILTIGQAEVKDVMAFGSYKKQDILTYAASLMQAAKTILSTAIVQEAKTKNLRLLKAKHVEEIVGRGLKAHVKGKDIVVGHLSLMEDSIVIIPSQFKARTHDQVTTYVAIDGKLAGYVEFNEQLRTEAKITLDTLKKLGANHTIMVTNDSKTVANKVAKDLGIDTVIAEALPSDKLAAIDSQTDQPLVFVGSSIKDSACLTAADTGIALGTYADTAVNEAADVIIIRDTLSDVARAMSIAHQTFNITRQSILVGTFISVVSMLAFSTGIFAPIIGALLQVIIIAIVVFNSLRARK